MATLSELPLPLRLFVAAYRWKRIDPVPCSRLQLPLSQTKLALVSTAGLVLPSQEPFDMSVKGGDSSFRQIPSGADVSTLVDAHRSASYDHSGVHADPNLGFPLEPLRDLVEEGFVGALNERHFSFMGSITAPARLMTESAPRVADALAADGAGAVLLVPI